MSASTEDSQATKQMLWGARHYAWLMVLCVAALAIAAPVIVSLQPRVFEARALVVAQQIELRPESLFHFGEALFTSGAVERAVAADPAVTVPAEDLMPERLRVVTGVDSPVFEVIGTDADAETAALLANLAANAFVVELNKVGPGIGTFALQDAARPPASSASSLSRPVAIAAGLLSGALLAAGLVALLVVLRRPVVGRQDAQPDLPAPVLSVVEVPRYRPPNPSGITGITAVARAVLDAGPGVVLVVSPKGASVHERERISVVLAANLERLRPLILQARPRVRDAVVALRTRSAHVGNVTDAGSAPPLLVIDGAEPFDAVALHRRQPFTVLVVRQGVRRTALKNAVAEYLGQGLGGVVLYRPIGFPALSRNVGESESLRGHHDDRYDVDPSTTLPPQTTAPTYLARVMSGDRKASDRR